MFENLGSLDVSRAGGLRATGCVPAMDRDQMGHFPESVFTCQVGIW